MPFEQAKDFDLLSQKIFKATGRNIGVTTLKCLFGTINDNRKTNEYTLNTIALFLGYPSWDAYTELNSIDSVWNFDDTSTYYIEELPLNAKVTINYLNRQVVMSVKNIESIKVLEVLSATNSSLIGGDLLYVHKIREGKILEAEKVVREKQVGNYKTRGEIVSISIDYQ